MFFSSNCSPVIPAGIAGIQLPGRVAGGCHQRLPFAALDSRQSMARKLGDSSASIGYDDCVPYPLISSPDGV
jgi:hypothetical protein